MKIAIISDIHDNLANLEKCLSWCKKNEIKKIFCLGDITNLETIDYLAENFTGEIFVVAGNCEIYSTFDLKKYQQIKYLGEIGLVEIENLKFALIHKPSKISRLKNTPDFIFHGHTHKPWIEKNDKTTIANPGNLAGTIFKASFAVLETESKKLELKILENI